MQPATSFSLHNQLEGLRGLEEIQEAQEKACSLLNGEAPGTKPDCVHWRAHKIHNKPLQALEHLEPGLFSFSAVAVKGLERPSLEARLSDSAESLV